MEKNAKKTKTLLTTQEMAGRFTEVDFNSEIVLVIEFYFSLKSHLISCTLRQDCRSCKAMHSDVHKGKNIKTKTKYKNYKILCLPTGRKVSFQQFTLQFRQAADR